ncbi:MAG: response regulator [Ardenticatenia bacterium]|nr:MAG: response regulator [Ardenticatenia bacterium]
MSTIRLLIVDDSADTRENLKKLLFFENDIEVVGTAASGEEAIQEARRLRPDIVLMDINMPGMDGIATVEALAREVPGTQVIMMSVQSDADYLRRSMLAGAREYLIKPFTSDELSASIRRVYALAQQMRPPQVEAPVAPSLGAERGVGQAPAARGEATTATRGATITAVFGAKGGVGATTLAVNMALALQQQNPSARVALVDADLQFGDVSVFLNLEVTRTLRDLAESIEDADTQFLHDISVTHSSGVKVLLAPLTPVDAELVTPDVFVKLFELLRSEYDYVLVNTRTSFHEPVLTILDHADKILLVMTTEIPAIRNTKNFFELGEQLGYDESKIELVLNRYDVRSGIKPEAIQASIRHALLAVIEADERVAVDALNKGIPFVLNQQRTPIAQGVLGLAKRFHEKVSAREAESVDEHLEKPARQTRQAPKKGKDGSLFGKLFGRS